jgi:phosphohistidine phosphatase
MKKTLYLVRHAHTEDRAPMFKDFDRELTGRGVMDAARMGRHLATKEIAIQRLVTSSAVRAFQTVKVMAEQLHYEVENIECEDKLYDGGPQAYLQVVNHTPEDCELLMLCGHNPDISYFAEYLTHSSEVGSMEKGSIMVIEFEGLSWAEVSGKTGTFVKYESPKQFRELQ